MTAGGETEAEQRMAVRRLPLILMYHLVGTVSHDPNHLCVTPGRFAEQMSWLRRSGLRGVSVSALLAAHRAGHARRLVGLTFDDGYAAITETAIPVLHEHGFTATVFVLPGRLGGVNDWDDGTPWPLLSRPQIAALAGAGMEIGSHTATHAALAGAGPDVLDAEVAGSRESLAALTGQPVRGFAYPYGSVGGPARDAVRDAGYDYACAVGPAGQPGRYALPRIYAGQADGPARLAAKRLLYRAYFSRDYYRDNLAAKGRDR